MGQILSCCFGGKVDPNFTDSDYSTDFDDSTDSVELPRVPCELCEQQYCRFTRVFSKLSPIPEEEFDQDQSTQTYWRKIYENSK